jgi:hypothetical protein
MKVLFLGETLTINFISRIDLLVTDNLTLEMRLEMSTGDGVVINPLITQSPTNISNKTYVITLDSQPTEFESRQKYEIEIKKGAETVFRGNVLILESGTSIQNYEYNSQSNVKFDYKQ